MRPMRIVMFYHSLVSDWNHGNAHFLRGVATELIRRGYEVIIYEPADSWSRQNLVAEYGGAPVRDFHDAYPLLSSVQYELDAFDLDAALDGADLVIVHEWNDHGLVHRIGKRRATGGGFKLLFHDTHHRSATDPEGMLAYDLSHYDGVLAFGKTIRDIYITRGWTQRAWTWHEAADTCVFHPPEHMTEGVSKTGDLVWIGNWGDEERTAELMEYLVRPIQGLGLKAHVYGVRYPESAISTLAGAGIEYGGWLPNYRVPAVFAQHRVTVHVPRRPYVKVLPGIPTIRVFEALACGIPLVCSPWDDAEGLFVPSRDFLVARHGEEMKRHLRVLLEDTEMAQGLAQHGRETVLARHTCAHRVDELLVICRELGIEADVAAPAVRECVKKAEPLPIHPSASSEPALSLPKGQACRTTNPMRRSKG
jgi:spore maturation protein CgeB